MGLVWPGVPNSAYKYFVLFGARGRVVVKALGYKPEGRGFEILNFKFT
jgi:hypothetical protein